MTRLAETLGLSSGLAFYDVYALDEPDILTHIPRPVHALLVTIPLTPAWHREREAEDAERGVYDRTGPQEPVLWFKQTIGHACGSIGLLHCLLNGVPATYVRPDSELARIRREAVPLTPLARARVLEDSAALEEAHQNTARGGQSAVPLSADVLSGNHFVAFIRGDDGHLWEMEGGRSGPIDRGILAEDEDALSEKALELGLRRVMEISKDDTSDGGDLRFSCIALAAAP